MMTKDKKPFTYTPGGIDLSQIKSPRMAKRISRNANLEGANYQAPISPLAQVYPAKKILNCILNSNLNFNFSAKRS